LQHLWVALVPFDGDQNNLAVLGVEPAGLGARLGGHGRSTVNSVGLVSLMMGKARSPCERESTPAPCDPSSSQRRVMAAVVNFKSAWIMEIFASSVKRDTKSSMRVLTGWLELKKYWRIKGLDRKSYEQLQSFLPKVDSLFQKLRSSASACAKIAQWLANPDGLL
jgi:hypothetical protein